jgi:hypothetical protein
MKQQIEQIVSIARSLAPVLQAAFVLTCAQRVAPAFVGLASARSIQVYSEAICAAWIAIKSPIDPIELRMKSRDLSELPEAKADDSLFPDYFAKTAMYPLDVTLGMLAGDRPEDAVGSVCFCNINLCAEFDADNEIRFIGNHPLEHGALEIAELESQLATLNILQSEPQMTEILVELLRDQAIDASQALEQRIPQFAKDRGWKEERG